MDVSRLSAMSLREDKNNGRRPTCGARGPLAECGYGGNLLKDNNREPLSGLENPLEMVKCKCRERCDFLILIPSIMSRELKLKTRTWATLELIMLKLPHMPWLLHHDVYLLFAFHDRHI